MFDNFLLYCSRFKYLISIILTLITFLILMSPYSSINGFNLLVNFNNASFFISSLIMINSVYLIFSNHREYKNLFIFAFISCLTCLLCILISRSLLEVIAIFTMPLILIHLVFFYTTLFELVSVVYAKIKVWI